MCERRLRVRMFNRVKRRNAHRSLSIVRRDMNARNTNCADPSSTNPVSATPTRKPRANTAQRFTRRSRTLSRSSLT